jgi:PE-PPE domain/PE family
MPNLFAVPQVLASAGADIDHIGSELRDAEALAASRTTGLIAAAQDEVSTAIANVFGRYGQAYQALISQAAGLHNQFSQTLGAAGSAYAQAEAVNATEVALVMGGTSNPFPLLGYLESVAQAYLPTLQFSNVFSLFTPEEFWPVTPQLGGLTFQQSVAQGVSLLDSAIKGQLALGNNAVVFAYSQSSTIATDEIRALMGMGSGAPLSSQLSFVLVGDPNNPDGGLLERFTGFYIPILDVQFNGATPANSPYPTSIYTLQYDGIADTPQYPLNVLSDVNALLGYFFVHGTYPTLTASQLAGAVHLATSPGYTGVSQYYMVMTQDLPLLDVVREIPYAGPPIADIFQPDLRVLVDLGYGDLGSGYEYANVATPASLLSIPNVPRVVEDLALGAVQGPWAAAVDIGVEAGWLPADTPLYPDVYPYVPSVDPHLHIYLGQNSVTGFSRLCGDVGKLLDLIPPNLFE